MKGFLFSLKLIILLIVALVSFFSVEAHAFWSGSVNEELIHSLIVEGDKALTKGRSYFGEALEKYTQALEKSPTNLRALFSKAQLASRMKENAVAISDLTRLLEMNPRHLSALQLRSSLAVQEGDLETAVRDLFTLVKLYREEKKSAEIIREAEKKGKALQALSRQWISLQDIIGADPLELKPLSSSTAKAARRNRFMGCIQLIKKIEDGFSTESVALRLLKIGCALAIHRGQEVMADIKFILQQNPHNVKGIIYNAMAMRDVGALNSAKKELQRCFSIDPENSMCSKIFKFVRNEEKYSAQVQSFLKEKKFSQALAVLDKMKTSEPNPPFASQLAMWRCEVLVQLKKVEDGLEACNTALESGAFSEVDIRVFMAELHLINDDIPGAEAQISVAKDIAPQDQKIVEMMRKIESLRKTAGRKNYYKILGISKSATDKDIHRAYRKLAKEYHPDKLRSKDLNEKEKAEASERFRNINEAKEILLDAEKRAAYDRGEDPNDDSRGAQQGPFYGQQFHFSTGGFPGGFGGFQGGFPHSFFSGFGGFQGQGGAGQQQRFFFRQT